MNKNAGSSQPKKEEDQEEPTLLEKIFNYFATLLKYKWVIVGTTGAAAVGVVIFSLFSLILPPDKSPLPNSYYAYATLLVSEDAGRTGSQAMLAALGLDFPGGGGGMNYGVVAQRVVHSRTFLDQIVEEFDIVNRYGINSGLRDPSREFILGHTTIEYEQETGILTVGYEDIDPEFAQEVANGIVDHLQAWFQGRGGFTQMQELLTAEKRMHEVEADTTRLESEILSFQREHGVFTVNEIADSQAAMISDLQAQLVELEVQIRNQETFSRIEEDPVLVRLRAQRANVIQLISQIEDGYTGGTQTLPARSELPELALEFSRLQRELEIQSRIYQTVAQQYEVARLSAESMPVFSVIEYAEVPERKSGPSRGKLSITVTVLGFLFSVAGALVFDYVKNSQIKQQFMKALTNTD